LLPLVVVLSLVLPPLVLPPLVLGRRD